MNPTPFKRIFGLAALVAAMAVVGAPASGPEGFRERVLPFFKEHCVSCHGPEKSKGKITVHSLGATDISQGRDLEHWETILDVLHAGEMPPEDEPQPPEAERQAVASWIESSLRAYVEKASNVAKAPTTRRLTNVEYENSIRDLLGFRLQLLDKLSKDPDKPYHFNNAAEYMLVGPEKLLRYRETARQVMAAAIVDPEEPEVHTTRREWLSHSLYRGMAIDEIGVWGNRRHAPSDGMGLKSFPRHGEFRIRMQASGIFPKGFTELPLRLVMGYGLGSNSGTLLTRPVGTATVRNTPDEPTVYEFTGRIENFPPQPGGKKNGQPLPDKMTLTPQIIYDDGTLNDGHRNLDLPRAVINWIEFEGPIFDQWPPAYHRRIMFDSPLRERDPKAYVRAVIERFATRAFRRPATADDVDKYVQIYDLVLPDKKTMEAAMRETLAMVLISPQFLYHTVADDDTHQQYELASKLSYFLWASMPDKTLIDLAAAGKLDNDAVIAEQVERLLADPRANDFIANFTVQWLSLDKMRTVPINQDLFPRFLHYVSAGERAGTEKPNLPTVRDYMIEETVAFVAELIRRNASALQIIDSDFAMVNQRLAAHYKLPPLEGHELRPVAITPEDKLGGLLTHGSILIGNGTGSAPHPIYRAVWLREAILGDTVAPPPAEVPALTDTAGESAEKALTIAELLAKHREIESCNDCHVRLDPWGIPFERYNAIGQFQPKVPKEGTRVGRFDKRRHKDVVAYLQYVDDLNTEVINASARVPHGPEVDGLPDLKKHVIKNRKDDVAANLIRRFLNYGLGRHLTYADRFTVEEILATSRKNDYKLRDMLIEICQSDVFRAPPKDQQARRE